MTTRAQVIEVARSMIGVPWVHQGRTRAGLDCVGMVMLVARELQLSDFEYQNYNFANDPQVLFDLCDQHMTRIELDRIQPGDVVTISYLGVPHHMGFLGDYLHGGLSLIHALNLWGRKVVEHRLDDAWRRRIVRAYQIRGVE